MAEPVNENSVRALAKLARLELSDDEIGTFTSQLADVLSYFEQLAAVDTEGIPPTTHPLGPTASLREDEARPSLSLEAVLGSATQILNHQFQVPGGKHHDADR